MSKKVEDIADHACDVEQDRQMDEQAKHHGELEALALEWLELSNDMNQIRDTLLADPNINKLKEQIDKLKLALNTAQTALTDLETPELDRLNPFLSRQKLIEDILRDQHDPEHKVKDFEKAKIEWRESRSLKILDTVAAVEILTANKKLEDGIGSFKIPFMRKLKDVGLLDDDVAAYDSKINVYVRPKAPETEEA